MLIAIPIALAAAAAGLLGYASTRPGTMRVQRSTSIGSGPDAILPLISNFHRWADWSPYEKLDPAMTRAYAGAPSGPGAVYTWKGNGKAGAGRMEITDVSPSAVTIQLDFEKPFRASNVTQFIVQPQGSGTRVTWSMEGPSAFVTRLMGIFMDLDGMIGRDFETGLANLKTLAEGQAAAR